jgi:hypothetical protein
MNKGKVAIKVVKAGGLMIGSYLLGKHGKTLGKEAYEEILKAMKETKAE